MAHKKAGGSSKNGRDSQAKRRGVKIFGGQVCIAGNVLIRQKGTQYRAGVNVGMGRDFTLFALTEGTVKYYRKNREGFDGRKFEQTFVSVV
jgi:large subunit ribosomal protein L27